MKRAVELSILKELIRQLDEKRNIDAGVMSRNPTDFLPFPYIGKIGIVMFSVAPVVTGFFTIGRPAVG